MRNLAEGFADGGFFAEGDGTGSMSSQIVFLSALQAWRNVTGRDFIASDRPNARMLTLKWLYQTVFRDGRPDVWPIRGGYPQNVWSRTGLSGAGYFALGFAGVRTEERAAMKWFCEGPPRHWSMSPRGQTSSLTLADGTALGVDFSGASGADVLLVTTGRAEGTAVRVGDTTLTFFFPTTDHPPRVTADSGTAVVRLQRVTPAADRLVLAITGQ